MYITYYACVINYITEYYKSLQRINERTYSEKIIYSPSKFYSFSQNVKKNRTFYSPAYQKTLLFLF